MWQYRMGTTLIRESHFHKARPEGRRKSTRGPKTICGGTATRTRNFISDANTKCAPRLSERAVFTKSVSEEVLSGLPMKHDHGHRIDSRKSPKYEIARRLRRNHRFWMPTWGPNEALIDATSKSICFLMHSGVKVKN